MNTFVFVVCFNSFPSIRFLICVGKLPFARVPSCDSLPILPHRFPFCQAFLIPFSKYFFAFSSGFLALRPSRQHLAQFACLSYHFYSRLSTLFRHFFEICQTFFSSFLKVFEIFFRKCQKHRKKHNEKAFKPLNYTFSEEKSQTYCLKAYDKTLHRRGGRFLSSCSSYAAFFRKRILNSLSFSSLNPFCL